MTNPEPDDTLYPFALRWPAEIRDRVIAYAEKKREKDPRVRVSTNGTILELLEKGLAAVERVR